jgi:hypothetical protein
MSHKILLCCLLFASSPLWAINKSGRMGVGFNNQMINDLPAISLKMQQNRYFALGAMVGFKSGDGASEYGAGLKAYRIIFQEELLNFFLSGTAITLSYQDEENKRNSGYQFDGTMGAEFHFEGIESIGFSFEFGVSMNKGPEGRKFETLGNNILIAGIHFYI